MSARRSSVLTRRKRKVAEVADCVSEDKNPPKRQKKFYGSQKRTLDLQTNSAVAGDEGYTPNPNGSRGEKTTSPPGYNTSVESPSHDDIDELFATEKLNSKAAVLDWLNKVVKTIPTTQVTDVLRTIGAQFPHCVPQLTKDRVYRAALDSQHAIGYNKERLQIPFINGAPGIGKTRMLLESLNILKECAASKPDAEDEVERNFKRVLEDPIRCTLLYTSWGNGSSLNNEDDEFWNCSDCSGVVAIRIIWKYFLNPLRQTLLEHVAVTKAMAKYLTLATLIEHLKKIGVKYIVLAIDEMNMLYADGSNMQQFKKFITSTVNVMLKFCNDLFVLYAGTIYSPVKSVIIESLAVPVSISPTMLSLSDMHKILNDLASHPDNSYLAGWQCAGAFRQCVADMLNPPRAFDYLMMGIQAYFSQVKHKKMNLWTLPYATFMDEVVFKTDSKMAVVPVADAKILIEYCITRKLVRPEHVLPSGKTIECAAQEGYVFAAEPKQDGMPVAVPFFLLYYWLQNDPKAFGCAAHLFKFSWNDPTAIGPTAWEIFNVNYTAFKLTLLTSEHTKTVPLCTFHSGALFGDECKVYSVQPRPTTAVRHLQQFPACFDGNMQSNFMTSMIDESQHPSSYMDTVCLNGKNTIGIDTFYWLSENVIELQQYKANDADSQNPTLTQADLDNEYQKAEALFKKCLAKCDLKFIFGLISNRSAEANLTLKPNMYVVHKGNMEKYYGHSFASVAQIKSFISVNVNTDDVSKLMKLKGVTKDKAAQIIKERKKRHFNVACGWHLW